MTITSPINVTVNVGGASSTAQDIGASTGQAVRVELVRFVEELRARAGL